MIPTELAFSLVFQTFQVVRTFILTILNKLFPFFVQSFGYNSPIPTNAVLVTGASSGIGKDAALYLAKQGYMVFAGVRKVIDGNELIKLFDQTEKKGFLYPVVIDVADESSVRDARKFVEERLKSIKARLVAVVNNAGILKHGLVEFEPVESVKEIMEVNLFGAYNVTQTFLPLLRAEGKSGGRVVNISSAAFMSAMPLTSGYSASKYALEGFSDVLRKEVYKQKIAVSIVEPGPVISKIFDKNTGERDFTPEQKQIVQQYYTLFDIAQSSLGMLKATAVTPFWTSTIIQHAIENPFPHSRYLVNADNFVLYPLKKVLPDYWFDKIIFGRITVAQYLSSKFSGNAKVAAKKVK